VSCSKQGWNFACDQNWNRLRLRLYEFSPSNNVVRVKTYSPWLNQWETDADSQFDIPYAMSSAPAPFVCLGTNTAVASGTQT